MLNRIEVVSSTALVCTKPSTVIKDKYNTGKLLLYDDWNVVYIQIPIDLKNPVDVFIHSHCIKNRTKEHCQTELK